MIPKEKIEIVLPDGTQVNDEDYLMSLDSNTLLIFQSSEDKCNLEVLSLVVAFML